MVKIAPTKYIFSVKPFPRHQCGDLKCQFKIPSFIQSFWTKKKNVVENCLKPNPKLILQAMVNWSAPFTVPSIA